MRLTGLVLGACLALGLAACGSSGPLPSPSVAASPRPTAAPSSAAPASPSPTPAPTADPDATIVRVDVTGGECPNGPCGATYVVHGDGRVEGPDGGPASIPPDEASRMATLAAATDWDAVRAVPFTGECPTAFDGQKHVYAFPAPTGEVVLDSCEFDLSGVEVVQAIDAALFAA